MKRHVTSHHANTSRNRSLIAGDKPPAMRGREVERGREEEGMDVEDGLQNEKHRLVGVGV
jgi:hypothetical protein